MRRFLLILSVLCLVTWSTIFYLLFERSDHATAALPTLMVLPSLTPSDTPTHTPMATDTPTATATLTPTYTATATATFTPTLTPTLATRVLDIRAVMPGVYVPSTATDFPFGTILLPAPQQPIEPLPDATHEPPPYEGWYSFESDNPAVRYSTPWEPRLHASASRGQYHRSENIQSYASFIFEGEGLRIRYVAARNMGIFQVVVDGAVIDTVDAYAPELAFPGTGVYPSRTSTPGANRFERVPLIQIRWLEMCLVSLLHVKSGCAKVNQRWRNTGLPNDHNYVSFCKISRSGPTRWLLMQLVCRFHGSRTGNESSATAIQTMKLLFSDDRVTVEHHWKNTNSMSSRPCWTFATIRLITVHEHLAPP